MRVLRQTYEYEEQRIVLFLNAYGKTFCSSFLSSCVSYGRHMNMKSSVGPHCFVPKRIRQDIFLRAAVLETRKNS